MANEWIVNSVNWNVGSGLPSASGVNTGRFWMFTKIATGKYDRRRWSYPGVNHVKIKKYGFRGRPLRGTVILCDDGYFTVEGNHHSDRSNLENQTFEVTMPSGTVFSEVELVSFEPGEILFSGYGTRYIMKTDLILDVLKE